MALHWSLPILVVDDTAAMSTILASALGQIGFKDVDVASDGTSALQKMSKKRYALVISDWNMKPVSGYDLLKAVRADDLLKATPFIMVTSHSEIKKVISAKKAGVDAYITIPFTGGMLRTKIEDVLGGPLPSPDASM